MRKAEILFRIILLVFVALLISCKSNSSKPDLEISYLDVEFKIPSNWNYKSQELENGIAHQISCWEKGEASSFVFQWLDMEMNLDEYIEIMKESLKEQISHKNAIFRNNKNTTFQNSSAISSEFSGTFADYRFEGGLIAFLCDGKTYLILHQGDKNFYAKGIYENIVSSLKIGFNTKSNSIKKLPEKWALFEIKDIGNIAIPPSMEIRDDNSYISLVSDIIRDNYSVKYNIEMKGAELTFQPKGTNANEKQALSKYARILINYTNGEPGEFFKWNEDFILTESEKQELNDFFYNEAVTPMKALNMKIIKWNPIEYSKINGISYMKQSFKRQMADNPVVNVEKYIFFNYDESVAITLSYRLSEGEIWADDLKKVINYFDFLIKK